MFAFLAALILAASFVAPGDPPPPDAGGDPPPPDLHATGQSPIIVTGG